MLCFHQRLTKFETQIFFLSDSCLQTYIPTKKINLWFLLEKHVDFDNQEQLWELITLLFSGSTINRYEMTVVSRYKARDRKIISRTLETPCSHT